MLRSLLTFVRANFWVQGVLLIGAEDMRLWSVLPVGEISVMPYRRVG